MKKIAIIFLILILISCAPQATPAQVLDTFTPTMTATSTSMPATTTIIPTVTSTPAFMYPTDWPMARNTLTPIPIPEMDAQKFHLKGLKEQDYVDLIETMDGYARDYDIPGPSLSRPYYQYMQAPIELLLEETVTRFPNSANLDAYNWHLAVVRAINDNNLSDAWIMSKIVSVLQSGITDVRSLNNYLVPNGFYSVNKPAPNLFGNDRESWVLQISVNAGSKRDGLYFVVYRNEESRYIAYPLGSYWSFTNSYSNIYGVEDYNKNGLDEVALKIGHHSGTMCGSRMRFFEWNGSKFVDLTGGKIGYDHCGGGFDINIGSGSSATTLEVHYPVISDPSLSAIYRWNGEAYVFSGILGPTPWKIWNESMGRGGIAYEEETKLLETLLASEEIKDKGAAYPDYLRYRLGITLAMQSKREDAIREFQRIISSPADPSRSLYPRIANQFIELYKDDASLYRACLATNRLHESLLPASPYYMNSLERQAVEGFSLDWLDATPLCNLSDAFEITFQAISSNLSNLPGGLDAAGVEIQYLYQGDLNLDGSDEWVIRLDIGNWILVYIEDGKYKLAEVDTLPWMNSIFQEITQLQIVRVKGESTPIDIFRSRNHLFAFALTDDFKWEYLDSWWNVKNFSVNSVDDIPTLSLFYSNRDSTDAVSWEGYRWNPDTHEFSRDLLDYLLFTAKQSDEVHAMVINILPSYPHMKPVNGSYVGGSDRFYYLAALTAEMTGDETIAARIYWQLWRDYPESPYALMAKYKLEQASP